MTNERPAHYTMPAKPRPGNLAETFLLLVMCWVFLEISFVVEMVLICFVVLYLAWARRGLSLGVFLILSPLSFAFLPGLRDYRNGSQEFVNGTRDVRYPDQSISPRTRVRSFARHGGCGTCAERERLHSFGKEMAVAVMYPIMGPPPGAYIGPYPTPAEAQEALKTATSFRIDPCSLSKESFKVLLFTGPVEINSDWINYFAALADDRLPASAAVWKNRCLILRVPAKSRGRSFTQVHLIDLQTRQPFALYECDR